MSSHAARVRVLGPLTVVDADGAPLALGGEKQRCFLALLLVDANKVVPVDVLIDRIWGERPPASAQTMLHQFASRLRPVLEPVASLVTQRPGYVLELPRETLDATLFADAVQRGKALVDAGKLEEGSVALADALALWHGGALEDLRYVSALAPYASSLEEQRLAALEERFEAMLDLGKHTAVIPELQALFVDHPERERLAGQLMLALYRAGRQAESLAVYDSLRRHLATELGLAPGPALEELHAAILAQDPHLAEPAGPRARPGRRRLPTIAVAATALVVAALVAAAVSVAVVLATGREGTKALVPSDERLPFSDVPGGLLGSYRAAIPAGQSEQVMTLRAADDPVCTPLLGGKGTCFLIHPVKNELDPGARGQAAYHDGMVILRYVRIPFIPSCEREIDRYRVSKDGQRLALDRRVIVMGPLDECSFTAFVRGRDD